MSSRTYYITTPIYYVNDVPHIGHAYTSLACDVLARFMRLDGRDVHFLTGTDEHGQKIEKAAAAAGMAPQAFTDKVSQSFRDLVVAMNFSPDNFIRTTEKRHYAACQALWEKLVAAGDIYLGKYAGWYSVRDETYFVEGETEVGQDGKRRALSTGAEVDWVEEPSYFFKLSAWTDRLLALYEQNPRFIGPDSRRNEILSFVRGGLQDLSVSRTSFSWGVPVPGDPKHIMYVWLDALTNYITGLGYPDETELWRRYWPADVHLIGKDVVRFHAVYWPAFLMSAGIALPKQVYGHGFLLSRGEKMSKSVGNVVDPMVLAERFGVDALRYFLLREVSFGQDGSYSAEAIVNRANAELANSFGNLAQRTLSMVHKNLGGVLPAEGEAAEDQELLAQVRAAVEQEMPQAFERLAFSQGIEAWLRAVFACNAYVDTQAPWALRKTDPERMAAVLGTLVVAVRALAQAIAPIIPRSAEKLLALIDSGKGGGPIAAPTPLFPRLELEQEPEAAA